MNKSGREKMDEEKMQDIQLAKKKQNEFLPETFRIEVIGSPTIGTTSQLKVLLNRTLNLDAHHITLCDMRKNVVYVSFKTQEAKSKALTVLNGYKTKDLKLTAQEKSSFLKAPKNIDKDVYQKLHMHERIRKSVTPYHGMPYEDQIKEKDKIMRSLLYEFGDEAAHLNLDLWRFFHFHKTRRKDQICEVDDFVESPVREKYCNQCEFTIGSKKGSGKPIVGFQVANYEESSVEIGPMAHLPHLNEKMKKVIKFMEKYLETSFYEPFDPSDNSGVWRQLMVRTSNNNDVMIIITIHPQEMDEEEIKSIKEDLTMFFTDGNGSTSGVTSIYMRQQDGPMESDEEPEYEHVYGKTYLEETLMGKTFRVSPDAFLQVNTPACEVLYEKISELAGIDQTTIVLDICCGVGTLGLSLAEDSFMCLGGEVSETSVELARTNAEANDIVNALFYKGEVGEYIENMLKESQRNNVTAIINATTNNLSRKVINCLRRCEYLDKLVYVSHKPESSLSVLQSFMRPASNTFNGIFFVPIRATPVDLFPGTPDFGLIVVLERYDECKWERIMNGNPRPKDQEYFKRIPPLPQEFQEFEVPLDREDYLQAEIERQHAQLENRPRPRPPHIRRDEWERGFGGGLGSRLEGGLELGFAKERDGGNSRSIDQEYYNRGSPYSDDDDDDEAQAPMDREGYLQAEIERQHAQLENMSRPRSSHITRDEWGREEDRSRQDWRGFGGGVGSRLEGGGGLSQGFTQQDFLRGYQMGLALRQKMGHGQGGSFNTPQYQSPSQVGFGGPASKKWKGLGGGQNQNVNSNFNGRKYF